MEKGRVGTKYHVIPVEPGIQRENSLDTRSGSGMTDKGVDHQFQGRLSRNSLIKFYPNIFHEGVINDKDRYYRRLRA